jgi:hypothetical protein
MKNPYQRKTVSKNQQKTYSVLENYQQFIQNIIAQRMIIALYHEGWALCATPSGQQAFPAWQSGSLARLLIKDQWENYKIHEITLKDLIGKVLPYLRVNDTHLSLDLTPEGQNILVRPEKFLLDLKNYLYQLYLQQPEVFREMQLPAPRSIRLH